MIVNSDCERTLRGYLANDILVQMTNDIARRWDFAEKFLGGRSSTLLLIQYRLAEFDALSTNIHVARAFDEWTYIAIALATERTKSVLLGGATAAAAAAIATTSHDILT
jgi:hypothetical protein